ncbi:NADP-dependent oxidoreductase [Stecheria intestinalis]|uniref:NADP-dependent oxidoreductase n=1 Tax=Stecheria intestinalis TaxID=2606630 RepID=UPI0023F5143D|nr:NADP-dependent oxidoreductase [Stecheria intestinalis]MDD5882048.1 NADP-dependent oxidoreductase [Stecheria intestinalis]
MKAAILTHYDKKGTDLEIQDIPVPVPEDDEILVRIMAAAVNPLDNMIIHGEVKLIVPYKVPLIMGNEFSGIVEKAGKKATRIKVGDRVYGRMPLKKIGAFAEYAAVKESALAHIPDYLSFEEAAAVPLTALTAMQAFEIMQVKPGESVFISGGIGSLGAMAIPVARSLGLHVYTNGSAENEERVRKLGAEKFIDYKKENYAEVLSDVDHVLDTLGDRALPDEFKVLKQGGSLVSLRGMPNGRFAKRSGMSLAKRILFQAAGRKYDKMAAAKNQTYDFLFVHEDGSQLEKIASLFDKDHPLETSIDTVFSLDQVNDALAKVRRGGSKGKTIIKVHESEH